MPLILRKDITPEITLGIWHINENIETLLTLCLPDDRREAAKFVNESRKIEWLAWHALLQTLHPGAKASYDPQGGPILDVNLHIGVSHTRNYAAVILAPTPCAIDIENTERDFRELCPDIPHLKSNLSAQLCPTHNSTLPFLVFERGALQTKTQFWY